MSRYSIILKNTAFLFLKHFFTNIVAIVAMAYIAQQLGVKNYGIFALAFTLPSFLCNLATLGLRGVMVRETACRSDQERDAFLGAIIPLRIALTFSMALFLFIIVPYFNYEAPMVLAIRIALVGAFFEEISRTINDVFEGIQEVGKVVIREIGVRIFTATLACLSLLLGYGLFAVCWVYVAGAFVGMLYMLIIFRQRFTIKRYYFDWTFYKKTLKEGMGFAFTGLGHLFIVKTDILMISQISGLFSLGIYNAASVLFSKIEFIPDALGSSMFPAMANSHEQKEKLRFIINNGLELMLLLSLPLTLGAMFVSGDMIDIIFGDDYKQSAVIFGIFALSSPFVFLNCILSYSLMSIKQQYLVSKVFAFAALTNVVLNYVFIINWGIQGAAVATLIVRALIFCLLNFFVQKALTLSFGIKRILNVIPAALLLLFFLYISESWHFTARIIVGSILYLGLAILINPSLRNICLKVYRKFS
jgi:O-antigen/teichoic acid export membrane protein